MVVRNQFRFVNVVFVVSDHRMKIASHLKWGVDNGSEGLSSDYVAITTSLMRETLVIWIKLLGHDDGFIRKG